VLSLRPEQLCLHAESAPERWSVRRRLALPLGSNIMHDLQTRDGTTLKLVEPRLGAPGEMTAEAWCGVRREAQPRLFDRPTWM